MLIHQHLTGSDDEPAALASVALLAQLAQDLLDITQGQFRTFAHPELVFDVLSVIQKYAPSLPLIATGATGFL